MANEIIKSLMAQGYEELEAKEIYKDMREEFYSALEDDMCCAEDVLYGYGFELDYVFDLL